MNVIDTRKKITKKAPFYSVIRDNTGKVIGCVHQENHCTRACMFYKNCLTKRPRQSWLVKFKNWLEGF